MDPLFQEVLENFLQGAQGNESGAQVEFFVFPGFAYVDEDKFFAGGEFLTEFLNSNIHDLLWINLRRPLMAIPRTLF